MPLGALPHHSFYVLDVHPWLGLLRGLGDATEEEVLAAVDATRVPAPARLLS